MELAIMLESVSTVYEGEKRPAIRDVNMRIYENELAYVVGPNASGKTTLLETINGLLPSYRGKVSVLGLDMRTKGREARCKIGYVPQDFMVEPGEPYTAFDVVLMGRYGRLGLFHRPSTEDRAKAMETLELLGMDQYSNRPMGKLSGGQQQKVMIARALAKEPRILLMDEPFSNLDPESRDRIPELIAKFHEEKKLTTIIVTHDIRKILKQCQRIIVMNNGRILVDESPEKALAALLDSQEKAPMVAGL